MASRGVIFKSCTCDIDGRPGRRRNRTCSRLTERGHGSWQFDCRVRDIRGRSTQVRRSGFPSQAAATRARDGVLDQSLERFTGQRWTVERWLRYWLTTRTSIRPTTLRVYTQHVEQYLIPHLGKLRLADVTVRHLTAMFTELAKQTTRTGEPLAPATLHRICATLRGALNAAIRNDLITDNPARRIELPGRPRPHAVVWTPERVQQWRQHGTRDKVAVWTAEHLATFLDRVAADRLYALWWLIALRGLRRGEAAGLRWCDVDLQHGTAIIVQQITCTGRRTYVGPPKSTASRRVIALDRHTVQALRDHANRQRLERTAAGRHWHDTGYVFTRPDGRPLHPDYLTYRFHRLCQTAELPPVRLHDLRHGAASLAHQAGTDLKTIQDQLGHASIVLTADTYTSVLPDSQRRAAAATAELVLTAARAVRKQIKKRRNEYGDHGARSATLGAPERPANRETAGHGASPRPARPKKRKSGNSTQRATIVHIGRTGHAKPQVNERAARDSNPEPTD
ncbi:tyrosine-type recombinase/integrase [Dactylosporangium sp. CA-152071]|uniref:tyrosine-type recombinase/integrase n=1 Tax=Dactylosporangium sp. CA-152071 TaxID=3239933 RepID=UPI003D8B9D8F